MKFCISNIAWLPQEKEKIYELINEYGFTGLETAPNLILEDSIISPYQVSREELVRIKTSLQDKNISLVSMQSLLFGTNNLFLFKDEESRNNLKSYLKEAIDFASVLEIKNLVFGFPKNRIIPEDLTDEQSEKIALEFFQDIAEYAFLKNTCIGLEANAKEYGANWITDTQAAVDFIKKVNHPGLKLNLDMSTMSLNNEPAEIIGDNVQYINHIHISEEFLNPVPHESKEEEHKKRALIIKNSGYNKYLSIEMKRVSEENNFSSVKKAMEFVKCTYGGD